MTKPEDTWATVAKHTWEDVEVRESYELCGVGYPRAVLVRRMKVGSGWIYEFADKQRLFVPLSAED